MADHNTNAKSSQEIKNRDLKMGSGETSSNINDKNLIPMIQVPGTDLVLSMIKTDKRTIRQGRKRRYLKYLKFIKQNDENMDTNKNKKNKKKKNKKSKKSKTKAKVSKTGLINDINHDVYTNKKQQKKKNKNKKSKKNKKNKSKSKSKTSDKIEKESTSQSIGVDDVKSNGDDWSKTTMISMETNNDQFHTNEKYRINSISYNTSQSSSNYARDSGLSFSRMSSSGYGSYNLRSLSYSSSHRLNRMDSNNCFGIGSSGSNFFGNIRIGTHGQSASYSSINSSMLSTSSKLSNPLATVNDNDNDNKQEFTGKTNHAYFDAFEEINDTNNENNQDDEDDELASILNALASKDDYIGNYGYIDHHVSYYHNNFGDDENDDFCDDDQRKEKEQFDQFGWSQFVSKVDFDDLIENMKIN